jgi:hypothetical protein
VEGALPSRVIVHWPNSAKYIASRDASRKETQAAFLAKHPEVVPLVALSGEYVAGSALVLSCSDCRQLRHGLYISDLVVSFTRTHFIAQELLFQGELIEAVVLLRKQMELIARLHELVDADNLRDLLRRTPNIRKLGSHTRRLYTAYSEIAHSSDPIHLQQLGRVELDGRVFTPVYPVYDRNALVTFTHQVLMVVEYHHWSHAYLSAVLMDYDANAAEELIGDLASRYVDAFVPDASERI